MLVPGGQTRTIDILAQRVLASFLVEWQSVCVSEKCCSPWPKQQIVAQDFLRGLHAKMLHSILHQNANVIFPQRDHPIQTFKRLPVFLFFFSPDLFCGDREQLAVWENVGGQAAAVDAAGVEAGGVGISL